MKRSLAGALGACMIWSCGGEEAVAPPPSPPPPPVQTAPLAETAPPAPPPKPPIADLEKAALASAAVALNVHDATAVAGLYAEDAVIRVAGLSEVWGRKAIEANMQEWFDTFSGVRIGFRRVWMLGDVVVAEWVLNGTYTGDFFGQKGANQPVGHVGLSILWFDSDGRVKEEHRYGDLGIVVQQVSGKGPPPPQPILPARPEIFAPASADGSAKSLEVAKGVYAAIDAKSETDFLAKLTDDVTYEGHLGHVTSKPEAKTFYEALVKAIPDAKFNVQNAWASGDWVLVEYTLTGTHKGAILGMPPTLKPIEIHAVDLIKISSDHLAKASTYSNGLELMTQLGAYKVDKAVVPPPGLRK
jgi:steroid delta-isomerase-like uncharacterized protein